MGNIKKIENYVVGAENSIVYRIIEYKNGRLKMNYAHLCLNEPYQFGMSEEDYQLRLSSINFEWIDNWAGEENDQQEIKTFLEDLQDKDFSLNYGRTIKELRNNYENILISKSQKIIDNFSDRNIEIPRDFLEWASNTIRQYAFDEYGSPLDAKIIELANRKYDK